MFTIEYSGTFSFLWCRISFVAVLGFSLLWPHSPHGYDSYRIVLSPICDQASGVDKPLSSINQAKLKDQHLRFNCGHLKNQRPLVIPDIRIILVKMWGTLYFVLSRLLLWITCLRCLAFWKNPKARLRTGAACGGLRGLWSCGYSPSGHITQIT